MTYRCPYCQRALGAAPQPRCPGCGKVMAVPNRRGPSERLAKKRTIENLWREAERKKAELEGALPPSLLRSPKFYFGAIVLLAALGAALFSATDRTLDRRKESPAMRALRHLDTLAVALGRYRFHTGSFPSAEQGLAALVRDPQVPKWDGPYISLLKNDPWGTPFVYEPAAGGLPGLASCGPDRARGTADDLTPDPARFDPGTAWTNGWVSAGLRLPGVNVLREWPPEAGRGED